MAVAALALSLQFFLVFDRFSSSVAQDLLVSRIAFGSCANQSAPQPIWDAINKFNPQIFIWLGDNIYGDIRRPFKLFGKDRTIGPWKNAPRFVPASEHELRLRYQMVKSKPGYSQLRQKAKIIGTWDDHDYGLNDAGKEFKNKVINQKLILDFLDEAPESPRRKQEGIYTSYVFGPQGKQIKIILLDTRYHRDPLSTDGSILGDVQWAWLEKELLGPTSEITIIASSIQVVENLSALTEPLFSVESWGRFPKERDQLFKLIKTSKRNGIFFISGDVHFTEMARHDCAVHYPLYDVTSSGLTQAVEKALPAPLAFFLRVTARLIPTQMRVFTPACRRRSCTYGKPNFGAIEIDWAASPVTLKIETRDVNGDPVIGVTVSLSELQINRSVPKSMKIGKFQRHCSLETDLPWIARHKLAILFFGALSVLGLVVVVLLFSVVLISKRFIRKFKQPFINNKQLDCYVNDTSTWGYTCNGPQNSCASYLIFKSQPPSYDSAVSIAYLLNSRASDIARLNQITDVEKIPANKLVLVPVNCSCSGNFYQHNASYSLKSRSEVYFSVANLTYQGLSTCQALMNQNVYESRNLTVGLNLLVPLRCACPSSNQIADGFNYLLTYTINWGDDIPTIAQRFGVDEQSVRDANNLSSSSSVIFPFNSLLIPLKRPPTRDFTVIPPPPQQSPEPPFVGVDTTGVSNRSKTHKWVYIGIGIGVGFLLLLILLLGFLFFWFSRRKRMQGKKPPVPEVIKNAEEALGFAGFPSKQSQPLSPPARNILMVDSLTIYKFEELQRATGFFGDDHLIQGCVYRGVINGDDAAIKRMKGDVSNEINILKRINHSNIIRLSGFCLHEGNSYLVYEFAENGSLSDWLHRGNTTFNSSLTWKQRVQIAYDIADGLHYLHSYASPPYIHKDLKSSNILLDGCFRAKVANFGLAKGVENEEGYQMTRHVVGTQGYMAPEYLEHGLVTPKLDVFAFGVVILELLSGREAASSSAGDGKIVDVLLSDSIKPVLEGENVRKKLKDFIDPNLRISDYPLDLAFTMAQLALNCVARDLNSRPSMSEVFLSLSKVLSSSLDWDPSDGPKAIYCRTKSE
ncbi:hypothetical protein H6P81_000058 [Aristolochia fimbriata]|uniref:Uncharacterized protein n=1 Tax=Aristolochia fimbriata TaxID=158543 RepID=A0AAV7F315_ARIFI|nr:hypothetical protein H6P81_000058 [Aristolochia fimbriata]